MKKGINKFVDTETGKEYSEYNLEEIVDLLNKFVSEKNQYQQTFRRFCMQII